MAKKKLLVFIIEDDPIYLNILEKKIRTIINCHVFLCPTIDLAMNNLSLNPDLIIADHLLPDGTSFDVLEKIKKSSLQIPVIVLSDQKQIAVAVELMERGAHTYLEKSDLTFKKMDKVVRNLTPYFTLKADLKSATNMLFGGRQMIVLSLILLFIAFIVIMFKR